MRKLGRYAIVSLLGISMAMGLAGCGSGNGSADSGDGSTEIKQVYTTEEAQKTKAMVVGDYDIYVDELTMYAIQEIMSYGVTSDSLTASDIETNKSYALSLLRQNKIIYNVALNNDVTLDDSDEEYIQTTADGFKEKVGQELLDAYGISDDTINRVLEEQALGSKFENDIKNDMGQTIQDDLEEEYKDVKFHDIYYMIFPTVKLNDDNEPEQDDDGNYTYVSDDEKAKAKENAEAALAELRAGEDYETVAEKYGVTDYSSERTGYEGAYTDADMGKKITNMENGECLDVFEDTLGYAVVYMINNNDEDYKESYISYYTSDTLSSQFETLQNTWLSTIEIDEDKDMEGTVWADYDFAQLVKNLEAVGAVSGTESTTASE